MDLSNDRDLQTIKPESPLTFLRGFIVIRVQRSILIQGMKEGSGRGLNVAVNSTIIVPNDIKKHPNLQGHRF